MVQPRPGDALGAGYRLVQHVGAGAAGDVWLAETTADGPRFAAKILKPEHTKDPTLVERFIRERSVLIGLRHPGIVAVRDLVVEGETLAIVMDHIPGGSLRDALSESKTLPAADALTVTSEVFDALAAAHEQGVAHRDIKPDNVLLTEPWQPGARDVVRVTDFGIASVVDERTRQTTGLLGTPLYMSPELISRGRSSGASDVYSAGILLYELLAGRTLFVGAGTDFTIAYRHVSALPPRLAVPDDLWALAGHPAREGPGGAPQRFRGRPNGAEARDRALRSPGALEPADDLPEPVEVERPATMLRGELLRPDEPAAATASTLSGERPDLGEAGQRTVVRALARPLVPSTPTAEAGESPPSQRGRLPEWLTKRTVALGAAGIVLLIGLGAGAVLLFPGGSEKAEPVASDSAVTANQQDQARPTGLSTARSAAYDPASKRIVMEIVYSAQKSDLSGELLEVLPALGTKTCPPVAWTGATATRHAASTTGMTVSCGWRLADVRVPRDGRTTVKASLPGTVADAAALHAWLDEAATATNTAVSDPQVRGTAYPAQRLKGISVTTPARTVSQSPLPITLLPVWPSGTDTLNPLYQSPSAGSPSQLLQDIAGGESNVRFSDSCGGAVAVSSDGLTMTALSITPECRLRASVGNFTDLESTPFSVTTRD